MNDILDLKSDKTNHQKRMLVKNKISTKEAKWLRNIFFILSLIASSQLNLISQFVYFLIIIPLLVSYNLYFKKLPLIGNIITSILMASVFIFTELVITETIIQLFIPALLAFNLSFIRELIKDLHDYKGDLSCSMRTLPILLGIDKTCNYLSFYLILSCVLFLTPYFLGIYSHIYLITLIFLIEIPMIYSLLLLLKSRTIKTFRQMTKLYKLMTFLGLLVILASKF